MDSGADEFCFVWEKIVLPLHHKGCHARLC